MKEVYFDNAATTRVRPEVVELMNKVMLEDYGNPSSRHVMGMHAERYLTTAAEQIAACLTAGRTVQLGVTPYSEETRKKGKKGTVKEDFTRQTVFMDDIDNKTPDAEIETPAHVAEVLP